MEPQVYNWTCSICSWTWVIQSTGTDTDITRSEATDIIGYPECVNEVYGLMSIDCLESAFTFMGLQSTHNFLTFDQAFAIARIYTGVINPVGMYHFMAIRGIQEDTIWVANSARGYRGVYDNLSRSQFNSLGPVQLLWITP